MQSGLEIIVLSIWKRPSHTNTTERYSSVSLAGILGEVHPRTSPPERGIVCGIASRVKPCSFSSARFARNRLPENYIVARRYSGRSLYAPKFNATL